MKVLNLLVLASLTLAVSCGGSGGGSSSNKSKDAIKSGDRQSFEGKCTLNSLEDSEEPIYVKSVLEVIYQKDNKAKIIRTAGLYEQPNCNNGLIIEVKSSGNGYVSDDEEQLFVDFTSETWTPGSKEVASQLNANEACGLSWKSSKATSVIGSDCEEFSGEMVITHQDSALLFCPESAESEEECFKMELK